MKIYTKTGDDGSTSLVGGTRVSKDHPRLEAYGALDQLNSHLGWAICLLKKESSTLKDNETLVQVLIQTQNRLFNFGSHMACEKESIRAQLPALDNEWVTELESEIDRMTAELPPLREFILPGGSESASALHICRAHCRWTERACVSASAEFPSEVAELSILFLNRLSDFLFTAARWTNFKLGVKDETWAK